ncbi:hypothetical protein A6A04_16070 [Paramagnetospirillum marisnigri]|uniref:Probable membrane transporter protein n=1 Tax=Paramagnetospirillum marisnigri TaxID=1285242 RepID=A0A178MR68_9PROT|nr:TSUP family transporter [Paramagnetospirillum marisnigri]OAN51433.1 hypothetical protein A6A04_16070 [Paramagnetospirillum marisnigri]
MLAIASILIFSLVQSLFGVGLLVFGTPTLLLSGFGYPETLATLLPASLAVSLLQVRAGGLQSAAFARRFALWCLAPMAAVLALVLVFKLRAGLELGVALALLAFAGLRAAPPRLVAAMRRWVAEHQPQWLLAMGVVHGLSNLGGGLLTIYAGACRDDKEGMRALTAFCYTAFASSQLLVLALLRPDLFGWPQLAYAATAAAMFLAVGQRMFVAMPLDLFNRLFGLFLLAYASLLILRAVGWL